MVWRLLLQVFVAFALKSAFADKFLNEDIIIEDPKNVAIDFSSAIPGPDGTVCVQRKKFVDKKEKVIFSLLQILFSFLLKTLI